ncbi:MAG: hypothetical protein R3C46_11770 [Hyphomonadaceae bacterium]
MSASRPRLVLACLAGLALAAASLPAQSQTPTPAPPASQMDRAAQRGLAYARETCAECHTVEPGIVTPPYAKAPSFSDVAATPGMTSMALNVWFSTSHPNMPNLIIPEMTQDDLFAYFAALRAAAKAAETPG